MGRKRVVPVSRGHPPVGAVLRREKRLGRVGAGHLEAQKADPPDAERPEAVLDFEPAMHDDVVPLVAPRIHAEDVDRHAAPRSRDLEWAGAAHAPAAAQPETGLRQIVEQRRAKVSRVDPEVDIVIARYRPAIADSAKQRAVLDPPGEPGAVERAADCRHGRTECRRRMCRFDLQRCPNALSPVGTLPLLRRSAMPDPVSPGDAEPSEISTESASAVASDTGGRGGRASRPPRGAIKCPAGVDGNAANI